MELQELQLINYYRNPVGHPHPDIANDRENNLCYLRINCAGRCIIPGYFYRSQPGGRNDYYLMYLYGGTLSLTVGEAPHTEHQLLEPGHLFVFPPHISFIYSNAGDEPIRYLWAHATGYGVASLLSDCAIPVGAPRYVGFPSDAEEKFRALFKVFLQHDACFDVAAAARFMDICAMFGSTLNISPASQEADDPDDVNPQTVPHDHIRRIYTSISYLHENLSKPMSVSFLAAMEHLCVSRYRTLFHKATGMSPTEYITKLRMHRAAELLIQTNLQVFDIALSVGYEDPQYFSRVFRRTWGVSPAVYGKRRKDPHGKSESSQIIPPFRDNFSKTS